MSKSSKNSRTRSACVVTMTVFFISILFGYFAIPFLPVPRSFEIWISSTTVIGYLAGCCLIALLLFILLSVYYSRVLPSRARVFRDGFRFFLTYSVVQGAINLPLQSLKYSDNQKEREFLLALGSDSTMIIISAWFFAVCLKVAYALVIEKEYG